MGVHGSGESVAAILRKPPLAHPLAVPPSPGGRGVWQIRRSPENPIGYVLMRPEAGSHVFDVYAYCRDDGGGRPWLRTFPSLNSAVAWAIQHEGEIHRFNAAHTPEPNTWPA